MNHADLLSSLLPPVSYQTAEPAMQADIVAQGAQLDEADDRGQSVLAAAYPSRSGDWLARWERLLGLDGGSKSYQRRLSAVIAKINATGGLSIPYFIQLAAAAGYSITISEPQPFRAGQNRAGERLAPEDIMFMWFVDVAANSQQVWHFRAGRGTAGSRLSEYADAVIETLFQDLKPAHTDVRFTYED